ncbi:MAG: HD domain-containing phosphohydrolase [Planctomycetota bacterium]
MLSQGLVLIADDNEDVRERLRSIIQGWDVEVEEATDGYEVCAKLRMAANLILLDTDMPDMDGFETLCRINEDPEYGDCAVAMLTAGEDSADRVTALEMGADRVVDKTISDKELRLQLRSMLKQEKEKLELQEELKQLRQTMTDREEQLRDTLSEVVESKRNEREAHLEAVRTLAVVAESTDHTTGQHVGRIGRYCRVLAEALGYPPGKISNLTLASTTHDVGKVAVPRSILMKPGDLTDEEWEVMREHPRVGARILSVSSSPVLSTGRTIALTHHEKWDGSGYPVGLSGDDIPIEGRICAIADVFDALTSDRPYRAALSPEKARDIITEGRGTQFDPQLVDLFVEQFEHVRRIHSDGSDVFEDDMQNTGKQEMPEALSEQLMIISKTLQE